MPGIEGLPPSVQMLVTVLGFMAAVTIYFYGFFKKGPQVTKDVVMPNINVMDSQSIREAATAWRTMIAGEEARAAQVASIARAQREQIEALMTIAGLQRRNIEVLEAIDERLRQEHKRLRDDA